MRKIILLTMVLSLFAAAAQAAEMKVGFFNMTEVALECNAFKDEMKKIENAYGAEGKTLENKEKELQKKFELFNAQQAALSAEARQDRQIELMRLKRDHDDKKNDYVRKISAAETKARDQIARVIILAAMEYGKRNKFSAVLDSANAGVLYLDASLDITGDIVKEANRIWKDKPKALTDGKPLTTGAARK